MYNDTATYDDDFGSVHPMFPLRFGQMQNCPDWFGEVQICLKHLHKLAQICKNFA